MEEFALVLIFVNAVLDGMEMTATKVIYKYINYIIIVCQEFLDLSVILFQHL